MKRIALFPLTALLLAACQDSTEPPGSLELGGPQAEIADAAHSGTIEHFYFLPPMVPNPNATGVFDGSLAPEVEICELTLCGTSTIATFTTTTGPGSETVRVNTVDEYYIVNWHTDEFGLDDTKTYRIIVSVGTQELGHADVDVVSSGKELKNVDTGEFIALKDGRTLPIKFRIEEGAVLVCVAPPSGLVNWWPGDTDAKDIQGTDDGVLTNGASAGAPGKVAGAFSFDGVNDIVTFGNTVGNFGTSDFTIDWWMKTSFTPAPPAAQAVISQRAVCGVGNFYDVRMSFLGTLGAEIRQATPTSIIGNVSSVTAVNDGQYHHIAVVRQGLTSKFYVDGVLEATNTVSAGINIANTSQFTAGRSPCRNIGVTTSDYNGELDDIEIFNKALSTSEVQAIFDAGSEGKCKP